MKLTLNLDLIDKKTQRNNSWKPEFYTVLTWVTLFS